MDDEIERLRENIATLNESLTITSQGNAKLKQQVATLQGLEAIAHEYGIDGFVEIEALRKQVAGLSKELQAADDELNDFAECIAINRMLEKQVAELRDALSKYGKHIQGCGHGWSCNCGFYEALARTAKEESK